MSIFDRCFNRNDDLLDAQSIEARELLLIETRERVARHQRAVEDGIIDPLSTWSYEVDADGKKVIEQTSEDEYYKNLLDTAQFLQSSQSAKAERKWSTVVKVIVPILEGATSAVAASLCISQLDRCEKSEDPTSPMRHPGSRFIPKLKR